MRLVMLQQNGRRCVAASDGNGFRGFFENDKNYPGDLDFLLSQGRNLRQTGKKLLGGQEVDVTGCSFLPPLARPPKILCVGLNYAEHSREVGIDPPPFPTVFCRVASGLVGHGRPMIKPAQSDQLDYEGELAVVIGRKGRHIPEAKALEHVAAYSVFNDGSVRDYQMLTPQWTIGKNFDATGAFGPWLATPEDLPPGGNGLAITTRLNGRVMQQSSTDRMIFSVTMLIARLSGIMTLEPGDCIVTGTPSGIGMSRTPPVFMREGDTVEVEVESVGLLRNPVEAEKASNPSG
jgi:2-keto-4-pentenoate hydratase/2-oxohepta-3-ene-1,7-dioic acid hydratase in catechol pathway